MLTTRARGLFSTLSQTTSNHVLRCHSISLISIRGNAYHVQQLSWLILCPDFVAQRKYSQVLFLHPFLGQRTSISSRSFSNANGVQTPTKPSEEESNDQNRHSREQPILVYEGPFASLTLKLKRISLTSAVIGIVGLPLLSFFYGSGSVPATGKLAIMVTAGVTAVGSTALLGYCFSPYVHTLELLPGGSGKENSKNNVFDATKIDLTGNQSLGLVRIITRDVLTRKIETVFDPSIDVSPPLQGGFRPFCNFMVKGLPLYVHPELIHDYNLRVQLVGEELKKGLDEEVMNKKKTDDDEFL